MRKETTIDNIQHLIQHTKKELKATTWLFTIGDCISRIHYIQTVMDSLDRETEDLIAQHKTLQQNYDELLERFHKMEGNVHDY